MRAPKELEKEVLQVYDAWMHGYLNGDIETYERYLDESYHFIGSTNNEEFLNKPDTVRFFELTADQMDGKTDIRNNTRIVEVIGGLVFITELLDAYFLSDGDWNYYGRFRFTSVMEKQPEGWRFLYQHFSTPDSKAEAGETIGYEKISEENLQLREAIRRRTVELEHQNRELEIIAALEKVRSAAMGMQEQQDLAGISQVIFEELLTLGMPDLRNVEVIIHQPEKESIRSYYYSDDRTQGHIDVQYASHPVVKQWAEDLRAAEDAFVEISIDEAGIEEWRTFRKAIGYPPDIRLERASSIHYYSYSTGLGALSISTWHPIGNDQVRLLEQFKNVFALAYQRYVDVARAQAQAREAQVEAALERVRARSLAMHNSEELSDCAELLFRELSALGGSLWTSGFAILEDDDQGEGEFRTTDHQGAREEVTYIPHQWDPTMRALYEGWKQGQSYIRLDLGGDAIKQHYTNMLALPRSGQVFQVVLDAGFEFPEWQQMHAACFKQGYLLVISLDHFADSDLLVRFARVFEQTYTRFLDLQKAEAQAREAQIEVALERVRSRSMAMHHSGELREIIQLVYDQLVQLRIHVEHTGFIIDYPVREDMHIWLADKNNVPSEITIPYFDAPHWNSFIEARKNGRNFFANHHSFEEKNRFYAELFKHIPDLPEAVKEFYFGSPGLDISTVLLENVGLYIENFSGTPYTDEENAVLMRFGKVFQQTYTRFVDLKKAEAQAREAEIELALERIRSQAMAMKESTDLLDIVVTMRNEFRRLGHEADYFWHMMWLPEKYEKAMTSGDGTRIGMVMELPRHIHGEIPLLADWEKGQAPTVVYAMDVDAAVAYVDKMIRLGDFRQVDPQAPTLDDIRHIGGLTFIMARTTHGEIGYSLAGVVENPPAEDLRLLERFAGAFDIAHLRFLDLKESEARAREVQVELGLERVRARTMAMFHSNELADAAFVLFEQLSQLGIDHERIAIGIIKEDESAIDFWVTRQGGDRIDRQFRGRMDEPTLLAKVYAAWKRGDRSMVVDLAGSELEGWLRYLEEEIGYPFDTSFAHDRRVQTAGFFSRGMLVVTSPEPLQEEARYLLEKFAGVFDLTYTRFSDLQMAEAQARTARIETALERVRARALAMQQPEELREIAQVLRHEMGLLGVEELETSTVFIHDEGSDQAECWFAIRSLSDTEEGLVADHITLDLPSTWVGRQMDGFFASDDIRTSIPMRGSHRREWIEYCYGLSSSLDGFYGEKIPDRIYHLYKFSNGAIGAAAPDAISAESWDLLQRTASVFSLAYARFRDLTQARNDLQRLKDEKSRAEQALTELRAAQAQLVQSEKMASLGELTAGIAHEIKNPLNFVNNFAEVSGELFEELKSIRDPAQQAELIDLLKNNLEKITEHGRRADAIVRSMLMHSRTGSDKKEPTEINALADEYLRLAYHGLRAKDKSFNASFTTDLDPAIPTIEIVPQDIGRVLLNLINNAFYAVSERSRAGADGYVPTVTVLTRLVDREVEIRVRDNGPGIPQAIVEKVFQPFFTTKPTGQGTGLGLSLAYDIVTKGHRGDLRVSTEEGVGTEFTIVLPYQS